MTENRPQFIPHSFDVVCGHFEDHSVLKEEVFDKPPLVDDDEVLELPIKPKVGAPFVGEDD